MPIIFLMLLLTVFSGCKRDCIYVRSEFINHDRLASVHAKTPDRLKEAPFYGQQIIVHWKIPACCYDQGNCKIFLSVLTGDYQQILVPIVVGQPYGTYIYRLMNCDYTQHEGILTYKVELYCHDELVEKWAHHTWSEWINIEPN